MEQMEEKTKDSNEEGTKEITSVTDALLWEEFHKRKLQLHYWYVDEECAHGVVTGHERLRDTTFIHTSKVKEIVIDKENGEAVITTENSVYHCPLEYCMWKKQEQMEACLPEYDWIKENYKNKRQYPAIEEGKILLVLSNFNPYYFNSLYYKPVGAENNLPFRVWRKEGTFTDSCLIGCEGTPIDIKYHSLFREIEIYSENTGSMPMYIENIGDCVLFVNTWKGSLVLLPGERKEVLKKAFEEKQPIRLGGYVYPEEIDTL